MGTAKADSEVALKFMGSSSILHILRIVWSQVHGGKVHLYLSSLLARFSQA